ncbi:hypothetical protein MY3957_008710 [Beauveria namnaoensis]
MDITATAANASIAALHYQVAQGTSLEHVEFIADSAGGSQQFSATRLTFNGCNTAVQLIWNWGWVSKSITVRNAKVGFRLYNDDASIEMATPQDDISSVNNGKFYGAHVSHELGKTPAGATGPSLDDLIIGMNRFSNDYPGEVVGASCWLIDGRFDPKLNGPTFVRPDKGIFFGPPALARSDVWAQEAYAGRNGIWEVNFLTRNVNRDDRSGSLVDNYYIMQWQCTPVLDPIQPVAVYESNPTLYYYGLNYMTPKTGPTVILHDAVGLFRTDQITEKYYDPTMQVFVRGLNLYMVSQNCKVSKSKNPLVRPPNRSKKAVAGITSASDHFDGIIFANGTTLDTVPHGFCFSQASCPRLN